MIKHKIYFVLILLFLVGCSEDSTPRRCEIIKIHPCIGRDNVEKVVVVYKENDEMRSKDEYFKSVLISDKNETEPGYYGNVYLTSETYDEISEQLQKLQMRRPNTYDAIDVKGGYEHE